MNDVEINDLSQDIKTNGLVEPITLHPDGSILDGRNRYRACELAQVEPTFTTWNGTGSPVVFVVSLNLHRRHLDESQRGMVAARLSNLERGGNQHSSIELTSQGRAAEMLNVRQGLTLNLRTVPSLGWLPALRRQQIAVRIAELVGRFGLGSQ